MSDTPEDVVDEEMAAILQGLRPGLVRDLADLNGRTLEELQERIQAMPWGDLATLAGYKLLEITRKNHRSRFTALPKLVDATRAAALTLSR